MTGERKKRRGVGVAGIFWGALIGVVALIVIMAVVRPKKEAAAEAPERAVPVRVEIVAPQRVEDTVVVPGRVESTVSAELSAETPGRITAIEADKGDHVTAGQVLLRIDDRAARTQLDRATVESRRAAADRDRFVKLRETGAVSPSDFDDIQARVDLAAAAAQAAEVALSKCRIVSPFDGVVDDRRVEIGEYATEGMGAFRVVQIDPIKVVVDIAERDVMAVKPGDAVRLRVPACGETVFTGTVSFVSLVADRLSNAYRAELVLENEGGRLRPGMLAEVTLVRGVLDGAVVVPLAAVIPKNGEHSVFVVKDGAHAVRRFVRMELIRGRDAVLSSGLEIGERLVVEGHRGLRDGTPVTVENEPGG